MNRTFLNSKPERVKEERKRLGLTQEEAAEKCGIRRQQWIRYEKGTSEFDGEALRNFGEAGASISYILTGERSNVTSVGHIGIDKNKDDAMSQFGQEMEKLGSMMTPEQQKALLETARIFAKQAGQVELRMVYIILILSLSSWVLCVFANEVLDYSRQLSLGFGFTALAFWLASAIIIFSCLRNPNYQKYFRSRFKKA